MEVPSSGLGLGIAESCWHSGADSLLTSQEIQFQIIVSVSFNHKLLCPSHQFLSESGQRGRRAETNEGDIFNGLNVI